MKVLGAYQDVEWKTVANALRVSKADLRKQDVLFHEYLVIAGLEETDDYYFSKRYVPNYYLANQTQESV